MGYEGDDVDFIIQLAVEKHNAKAFKLQHTRVTDNCIKELIQKCPDLDTLCLSDCKNVTDATVMEIAQKCTKLKTFECPPGVTDKSRHEFTSRGYKQSGAFY